MWIRNCCRTLGLAGLVAAAQASAVGLSSPPVEPVYGNEPAAPRLENWSSGSHTLVPLMAADSQASRFSGFEAPGENTGGAVAKPVDDASFVKQATESGRKEVASARAAQSRLRSNELKSMAETLVRDHTSANQKLASIAQAKGWPVPAPRADSPPPAAEAGSDFDQKWTAEMIAGHERSVALFRAQAQGGEDKDLRQFARDTLPTIEHHLAELRKLQK